jgi:hypothetical protein
MGRQPQPKSEKDKRGTLRPERDRTVTISSEQETPQPPDSLDGIGLRFWELAYRQPWIGPADEVQVVNVAQQCSRQAQLSQLFTADPADFRVQRALKELDRSIESGLDQLLMTPNARRRAGIELTPPVPKEPTALDLMLARRDERDSVRLLELSDKGIDRIEALMG